MTTELLPPAEFNPIIFLDENGGRLYLARVECWGREVARVMFHPLWKPERDWGLVVARWGRMIASREFRRWKEGKA